jgi:hypothetical protein
MLVLALWFAASAALLPEWVLSRQGGIWPASPEARIRRRPRAP